MVKGLDTFRKYFVGYEDQYVLIGGAACDIVFESNDANFRATRDLDMVLIIEALTPEFGEKFWKFIVDGKYRNRFVSGRKPQFYRFDKPEEKAFPKMIELFCRTDFELKNAEGIGDSKKIKKHKKDILRIAAELMLERVTDLPETVLGDIYSFIDSLEQDPFDLNLLKMYGLKNEDIVSLLKDIFEAEYKIVG